MYDENQGGFEQPQTNQFENVQGQQPVQDSQTVQSEQTMQSEQTVQGAQTMSDGQTVQDSQPSRSEIKAARKRQKIEAKTAKQLERSARKRAKKEAKAGKKTPLFVRGVRFVALALVFGLIAGCAFYGVCYAGNIAFPIQSKETTDYRPVSVPEVSNLTNPVVSREDNTSADSSDINVKEIVKADMPAVVAITGTVKTSGGYFYPAYESPVSGTGVIIGQSDNELYIVTNAHVVDDVNNLKVTFVDGASASAVVKGSKSNKDIAVVSVSIDDLNDDTVDSIAIMPVGDSDEVELGDPVIAIGNAMGEGQSVTVGWISALNRTITIDDVTYENLFMTDAAINPGNSGGALINAKGELIGINSAKKSSTSVEGMGYAIPISSVADIIDKLVTKEQRQEVTPDKTSYLGIRCQDITEAVSLYYGYPQGVFITSVVEDSPADKAGLEENDIIVSFDDNNISSYNKLTEVMKYYAAGEEVTIEYYHYENRAYVLKTTVITLGNAQGNVS